MRQKLTSLLYKKNTGGFQRNVKAILGEIQHLAVIADIDMKKIKKVVRNTHNERKKISLLKDVKMRTLLEESNLIS